MSGAGWRGDVRLAWVVALTVACGGAARAAEPRRDGDPGCLREGPGAPEAAGPEDADAIVLSEAGVASTVHIRNFMTALAVSRAVCGAYRRLRRPGCERLFSEFADADGTALRDVLTDTGHTREGYLATVLFYDGSREPRCASEATAATTSVRSHAVFICPAVFRALESSNSRAAETLIIHEMLHSLGLGEDPPSTWQITKSVFHFCP